MIIWWLRNDRRLHDNECWEAVQNLAAQRAQKAVALYAWNGLLGATGLGGIPRLSPKRVAWIRQSLDSLKADLATHGVELVETEGSAAEWLAQNRPSELAFSQAVAWDERMEEAEVQRLFPTAQGFWTHCLLQPDTVPGGLERLPPTFTPFRHKIERENLEFTIKSHAAPRTNSPQHETDCLAFGASESEGLSRLRAYLANPEGAAQYKTRRNGLLGTEFSTKFSIWLASGALSPRRIWQECLDLERQLGGSPDIEWIRVELLWREYFQWVAYTAGPRLFFKKGFRETAPKNGFNARAFERWASGTTGDDLVDAGMRELAATGFSSNRARQNMASYLIHDLGLDWRYGAAYFESQLLDYDPASNWANWAYIAGVGNDPRPVRRFNTAKQAQDYDPEGAFRRHWLR